MKIDNLSYEETLIELDKILKDLEGDDCSLNQSIDKFKQGILLYNHCNELLSKAEGEVKIILKDDSGNIRDEEFLMEG